MTDDGPQVDIHHMNDLYDALTVEIIERVCGPESSCVDVGAGMGDLLKHMVRVAPAGRHFAVEPLPRHAEHLRREFAGVEVCEAAASADTGSAGFVHVASNPGYSGLHRRPYDRDDEVLEEIRVATTTLDELVGPDARIDLIKIDVEGGEVGVIRGASGILRGSRPVIAFEHGGDRVVHEYGVTTDDLWRELAGHGYRIWTLPGFFNGDPALDRPSLDLELQTHWYFVAAHPANEPGRRGENT
ncbi:FkbM family methyltransferase [Kitasatospora sp. NPDC048239]|uniref:FkbM family methyltransferase n=1 Tax=Kitasatospora sp. NPDC048239 TaxID=3364046 RepID=UPI003724A1C7